MSFSTVAVVGLGPQGCSLAQAIAQAEIPVLAVRACPGHPATARRRVERELSLRVREGELGEAEAAEILDRITFSRDLAEVRGHDLVIESAGGAFLARRAIVATLETCLSQGAVLASNLPGALLLRMAEAVRRRDQLVGMRFFHPATRTRLVEISTLPETAPGVRLACENFCRWLDKSPVEVAEGEGAGAEGELKGAFSARARHLRGALLASGLGRRSGR